MVKKNSINFSEKTQELLLPVVLRLYYYIYVCVCVFVIIECELRNENKVRT